MRVIVKSSCFDEIKHVIYKNIKKEGDLKLNHCGTRLLMLAQLLTTLLILICCLRSERYDFNKSTESSERP